MGWLETIKDFAGRAADALRELPSFFKTRPRLIITGLGAVVVVCAAALAAALLADTGSEPETPGREISGSLSPRAIPAEELFLPDEPDFLPEVLLSRDRREQWTVEDALPYWTDPLGGESAPPLNRMRRIVDTIMERVP
ncbi:MAG: hypothetical protein LBD08_07145 [Treponema sp.]|nr:hypothetical protein [Treponema sp.]